MADIDIERKPSSGWLWALLGLVVLALILFWLLRGTDTDTITMTEQPAAEPIPTTPPATAPTATATPAALQQYQQQCATPQPQQMSVDHQYTAQCMNMLVEAITGTLPPDQVDAAQSQLQTASEAAASLAASPADATSHSATTQQGFMAIASALQTVQQQSYPELAGPTQDLAATAQSMNPAEPLLDQSEDVQRFFEQAGNLLNRMNMASTA